MLPLRKYHLLLFNYMTMRQKTINNLIEISPQAEGSFLTQAFPTNFHQFYTKKLLTPQESVSDYKEVTAAEKANIINTDSQWVEPSEELKVTAKVNGAVYNVKTGFFELNTLTDITAEQMRAILPFITLGRMGGSMDFRFIAPSVRTLTVDVNTAYNRPSMNMTFAYGFRTLEVVKFVTPGNSVFTPSNVNSTFRYCQSLRLIDGTIDLSGITGNTYLCDVCPALEEIRIKNLKSNIFFADSPLLSLTSIQYMVDNAANTSPITITVHPDVYAKLTATKYPAQAHTNLLIGSDVPVTTDSYLMKKYQISEATTAGALLTVTVWGTPSAGATMYYSHNANNLVSEGGLTEISPGVWQRTFPVKAGMTSAGEINIFNFPKNDQSGHIEKVKLCYGLDPDPQWTAPVEMPTDPEALEAISWERVMLVATAKQINFATTS